MPTLCKELGLPETEKTISSPISPSKALQLPTMTLTFKLKKEHCYPT